jgi:type IV secretory pathway VirB10-like protein
MKAISPVPVAVLIVTMVAAATPAWAQYYDPCLPPRAGDIFGAIINQMNAPQRAQACQQARDAAMRQQQAAAAAQQAREAEAQRAAARARADAEAQARIAAAAQAEAEARAQAQARDVAAAQVAAETSPDNFCREPDTARHLITAYNGMDWQGLVTRKVVDIEHLVTIKKDPETSTLVCHGIWVHTNGAHLEGTMTMRPNVAGDIIVSWEPEHWQPPVTVSSYVAPVLPPPPPAAVVASSPSSTRRGAPIDDQSPSYQQGRADRLAWEQWFATLSGDDRLGAEYWTGERHKADPGSCVGTPEFQRGCAAARQRLATPDVRRKTEPQYWYGWNSL